MNDYRTITGTPDGLGIDLNREKEVHAWCESLDCSEQQLRSAVDVVGSSAKAVRAHLGRSQA